MSNQPKAKNAAHHHRRETNEGIGMKRFTPYWMNSGEVAEALRLFGEDVVLGPAARFLNDLMEFVNATTDGWCFHNTAQAAGELQGMLYQAKIEKHEFHQSDYEAPTRKDVERVCHLAITNLKRKKHYQRIDIAVYGATWPVLEVGTQSTFADIRK